jgi:hypothetical protein
MAPVVALAAAMAFAPPAAAQGNKGAAVSCGASDPQVIATYKTARPVDAAVVAQGGVACPTPQNEAPGSFGPRGARPVSVPPPTPGSPCNFTYEAPIQLRLSGSTPEYRVWAPSSTVVPNIGTPFAVDPNNPGFQPGPWKPVFLDLSFHSIGINLLEYMFGGTTWDYFAPFSLNGHWNAQGQCAGTQQGLEGWIAQCTTQWAGRGQRGNSISGGCQDAFPPPVPIDAPNPIPLGALPINLNGLVQGIFTGGQISSMPAAPRPGLVNAGTCFYVTGMTIDGALGDPLQDHFLEQIVQGPEITEGRHVYYVILMRVYYQQTIWDFGDRTTVPPIPGGGSLPEPLPQQCGNVPGQQFLVAHTYRRFSTGGGFPVTVTHEFGVDVTEMWQDGFGAHVVNFPNAVAPVPVVATNQPYMMPVVQEEGVPVS